MGSTWRKAKAALGMNLCVYVPSTLDDEDDESTGRYSNAAATAAATTTADSSPASSGYRALMPTTPTPTSSGLKMSKSGSRSSKMWGITCSPSLLMTTDILALWKRGRLEITISVC